MRIRDPYREIATEKHLSSLYLDFSYADGLWCLGFGAVCVFALHGLGLAFAAIASIMLCGLTLVRLRDARVYMTVFDTVGNWWIRHVQKGVIWKATPKQRYYPDLLKKILKVDLPDHDEPIGLIQPDDSDGLCAVIIGTGWETASKSRVEQRRALDALGRKFRSLRNVGLSDIFMARPFNPWPTRVFYKNALDPIVFLPITDEEVADPGLPWATPGLQERGRFLNAVIEEEELVRNYVEKEVTEAEVVYVTGNRDLTRPKKGKPVDTRTYMRSPIVKATRTVVHQLRASGVRDAQIASYRQVLAFVRASWDGINMGEQGGFYDLQQAGATTKKEYVGYLPTQAVNAFKTHLVVDGVFIAMVKVTAQRGVVTPDIYRDLHSILDENGLPLNFTIGKIGANVSAKIEQVWLNRLIPGREVLKDMFLATSYRSTAARKRAESDEEREENLGNQGYRPHNYIPVGLVFAPSVFALEDNLGRMTDVFTEHELEPVHVTGERQQLRVFKSMNGANRM